MKHAVALGLRPDDPTRNVKAARVKSDGYHSWTDAEIDQFEKTEAVLKKFVRREELFHWAAVPGLLLLLVEVLLANTIWRRLP